MYLLKGTSILREYPFKFSRRFKKSSEGGESSAESASRTVAESDNRSILREYPFKFFRRFKKSSEGGDGGAESASRTAAESDNRLDFTGIVPQSSVFTLGREKLKH